MTAPQSSFELQRNPFGRLVLTDTGGTQHVGVIPVRAFPISGPGRGLSLMSADGHEIVWVDDLATLDAPARALIEEELSLRDFVPEISRIVSVSSFITPSNWHVLTDRGETTFVLKGEEDIRRLPGTMLLIADQHGVQYLIRDLSALDRASRRLLDRFL